VRRATAKVENRDWSLVFHHEGGNTFYPVQQPKLGFLLQILFIISSSSSSSSCEVTWNVQEKNSGFWKIAFWTVGYESGEGKGEEGTEGREGAQPRRYRPRRRFEPNNYYTSRPRRPPANRDSQAQDGVGITCTVLFVALGESWLNSLFQIHGIQNYC